MTLQPRHAVLYEMMRSFVTLAHTLNLSETVSLLGVTRQTVRRHIRTLEEIKGKPLFEVRRRSYALTASGEESLAEAERILERSEAWLAGHYVRESTGENALAHAVYSDNRGHDFHAQQHPISRLWADAPPLLQKGFLAWAASRFQIETPEMAPIRPYLLLYRQILEDWICVSIGEKSSYATWFAWTEVKSAIGRNVSDSPTQPEIKRFVANAYTQIINEGGARLDHIYAQTPHAKGGKPTPVSYQRLLLGCAFPDGSPVLASLVARTYTIDIPGLDPEKVLLMPSRSLMDFDIP
ncbi:MAG: LysR family transcriptional regulator [Rhodovibrionaceae bacterium]